MKTQYQNQKKNNKSVEKLISELSAEQQEIVKSDLNADLKIIACAGSGKTTTLLYRILFLISKGVKPESIIISTFNVEASNNLKIKARQLLEENADKIKITNIDKFTYEIYKKYLKEFFIEHKFKPDVKEIGEYAKEYLSTEKGRQEVFKDAEYFFFDEFQDVNQYQYDILILFKKCKNKKITVIGDDAQHIYSFRESKREYIKKQINIDVQNIKTKELNTNFRCSSNIIEFCNQTLEKIKNDDESKQLMQSPKQNNYFDKKTATNVKPVAKVYQKEDSYASGIINEIKQIKENHSDYEWSDFAILSPTKKHLIMIQNAFEIHNSEQNNIHKIPYTLKDKTLDRIFENKEAIEQMNSIFMSTIHCSKGLEWKAVFLVGMNDSDFPKSFVFQEKREKKEDKLSECRRMFYVACTRSINYLNFSFIEDGANYICRFFSEIQEKFYEKEGIRFKQNNIPSIKSEIQNNRIQKTNSFQILSYITETFKKADYEKINNILLDIEMYQEEIVFYENLTLDEQYLRENNLQQDFLYYIDLFLQRSIDMIHSGLKNFQFEVAKEMCAKLLITEQKQKLAFIKYNEFFQQIDFDSLENEESMLNQIEEKYKKIDKQDLTTLQILKKTIKNYLEQNNLKYKDINVSNQASQKVPYQDEDIQKLQLNESYRKFIDNSNQSKNIKEAIFKVSQCLQISNKVRKQVFRSECNDYKKLHPEDFDEKIENFFEKEIEQPIQQKHGKKSTLEESLSQNQTQKIFQQNASEYSNSQTVQEYNNTQEHTQQIKSIKPFQGNDDDSLSKTFLECPQLNKGLIQTTQDIPLIIQGNKTEKQQEQATCQDTFDYDKQENKLIEEIFIQQKQEKSSILEESQLQAQNQKITQSNVSINSNQTFVKENYAKRQTQLISSRKPSQTQNDLQNTQKVIQSQNYQTKSFLKDFKQDEYQKQSVQDMTNEKITHNQQEQVAYKQSQNYKRPKENDSIEVKEGFAQQKQNNSKNKINEKRKLNDEDSYFEKVISTFKRKKLKTEESQINCFQISFIVLLIYCFFAYLILKNLRLNK